MKKNISKKMTLCLIFLILFTSLVACKGSDIQADKTIKIGGTEISKVSYDAMKKDFEKKGYKTEFIIFDSNPVVLEACNSGDIDIALGQHKKFVMSFNENKKADLDMVKPYGYYTGIGLYSEKYKSIEEFPQGSTIAIMNDSMNMDTGLRVLQDANLIKISDNIDGPFTIGDIVENPKKINIVDMDQAQTVRSLQDMDGALVFFTHMYNSGKDPKSYILRDQQSINCPMGPITKSKNASSQWAIDFASCLRIPSVQDEINKAFPGVFTFYTDDSQVTE